MHSRRTGRALRRRSTIAAVAALTLIAALPVAAAARDWQDGDVFVGLITGEYNVYDNGGTLHETISQGAAGFAVDCAFDRSGVLFTTAFTNDKIVRFLLPHSHTRLADIAAGAGGPESVSFARNGSFFVGHQSTNPTLLRFTGAGTLDGSFSPANPATLLDLAADQRTMFYTSRSGAGGPKVHRFDVAANADLPDFADLGGTAAIADLKLLPPGDGSGGLIVAQSADIKRVNGSGAVIQTYDVAGEESWFGIALDPNGQSFWAQTNSPGNVYRFNIATGAVDRGPLPSAANAFGICVKGTRTAALDNGSPGISISTPANGATFQQGQSVAANYSCADHSHGTGIASCAGPVGPGTAIDTSSPGPKTFTVNASDVAGNTSSLTHTYTVVPPPPPPPQLQRINVTVSFFFRANRRFTTFTRLQVKSIPRGSTLRVRCVGKRCPKKTFTKRNARGTVSLTPFIRERLRVDTKLEITVTKSGMIGAFKRVTIKKNKEPSIATRCVPPGGRPQRRC